MNVKNSLLFPVTALMTFFLGFEAGGFQLVVSKIAAEFSLNGLEMGWMIAAQYIAIIVMPLLLGGLADRVGKKRVLIAFLAVFIVGCAVVVVSPSSIVFILGIFVVGCGYCICESTSSAALSDRYGDRSHKQLNFVQCCFSLGAVCGPLLSEAIMSSFHTSWRTVFVLAGAAYLLLLPLLLYTRFSRAPLPSRYEIGGENGRKIVSKIGGETGGEIGNLSDSTIGKVTPRFFSSPLFICLLAAMIFYVGMENGMGYFMESFFTKELSAQKISAFSISLFWLSMASSRLAVGLCVSVSNRLLIVCFGGSAALLALLTVMRVPVPSLVVCCLIGMLFGPVWPTLISLASREYPEHSGRATNTMIAGCGAGGALAPILLGGVMDIGGMCGVFTALALIALAGCLVFLSYLHIKGRRSNVS